MHVGCVNIMACDYEDIYLFSNGCVLVVLMSIMVCPQVLSMAVLLKLTSWVQFQRYLAC